MLTLHPDANCAAEAADLDLSANRDRDHTGFCSRESIVLSYTSSSLEGYIDTQMTQMTHYCITISFVK